MNAALPMLVAGYAGSFQALMTCSLPRFGYDICMTKLEHPISDLHRLFSLNDAGELVRRVSVNNGNGKAGTVVGSRDPHGYLVTMIRGKLFKVHRIIFAMTHGRWPDGVVDHINGNRQDNRPANLRECNNTENVRHRTRRNANNTSGHRGVTWSKVAGKWSAEIKVNRVKHYLGLYVDINDAIAARLAAEKEHYGEYAPTYPRTRCSS